MTIPVRLTIRPDLVFNVGPREFDSLLSQGLIYGSSRRLYVTFLSYSDGPAQEVEDAVVRIQGPAPSTADVVAETATGVERIDTGAYAYRWGTALTPAGTYTVTWTGVDVDDVEVTATEDVVVT